MLSKDVAHAGEVGRGEAFSRKRLRGGSEHLREIRDGVARDRKGELGLAFAGTFDSDHQKSASVEDGGQRGDPGLVVVLGAEEGQHGIGKMAFHELGRPVLPFLKELAQCLMSMGIAVATEELTGGGRRTRARIEKRDIHFAAGEKMKNYREGTEEDSQGK